MMREIKIGNKFIGKNNPTFVIAEAGCNHDCILERGRQRPVRPGIFLSG